MDFKVQHNRKSWMKDGKYLPDFMRDFHAQKDLFKSMHQFINMDKNEYAKKVDWVTGQCYVIDIFLWFMGMHGYTLQKSRAVVDFLQLEKTLQDQYDIRCKQFASFLNQGKDAEQGVQADGK